MKINVRFTESHEWVQLDGKVGTVGITDYAQHELGEIVYIELPTQGASLKAGQEACVLESTKAAADIYSPVSGKVIAVNDALRNNPSSLNQTAQSTGWLFQIELSHPKEYDHLLTPEQYQKLIS